MLSYYQSNVFYFKTRYCKYNYFCARKYQYYHATSSCRKFTKLVDVVIYLDCVVSLYMCGDQKLIICQAYNGFMFKERKKKCQL